MDNLIIKYDSEYIELAEQDELLALSEYLFWKDCYFFGETFCISNFAEGHAIYDAYQHAWYVIDWSDLPAINAGKTVTLYAKEIDSDIEKELINEEYLEGVKSYD